MLIFFCRVVSKKFYLGYGNEGAYKHVVPMGLEDVILRFLPTLCPCGDNTLLFMEDFRTIKKPWRNLPNTYISNRPTRQQFEKGVEAQLCMLGWFISIGV